MHSRLAPRISHLIPAPITWCGAACRHPHAPVRVDRTVPQCREADRLPLTRSTRPGRSCSADCDNVHHRPPLRASVQRSSGRPDSRRGMWLRQWQFLLGPSYSRRSIRLSRARDPACSSQTRGATDLLRCAVGKHAEGTHPRLASRISMAEAHPSAASSDTDAQDAADLVSQRAAASRQPRRPR